MTNTMKALSLRQPWASLVAYGEKRIETRSFPIRYRGLLAIHASARMLPADRGLCALEPFASALRRTGVTGLGLLSPHKTMPFGAVLAVVRLVACYEVEVLERINGDLGEHEIAFGNYEAGRYAWELEDAMVLPDPVPWKGSRGLWNLPVGTISPGVLAAMMRA